MASLGRVWVLFPLAVLVDLSLFYAPGCVVARSASEILTLLWVCAALRCLALTALGLLALGKIKSVLIRFTAVHGALPAVFASGSRALQLSGGRCGLPTDPRCWALCAGASLAAAMFWELGIPDNDDEDSDEHKKQESRQLFGRVLGLYKPLYHLLAAGFLFLTLAVTCKLAGSRQ